MVKRHRTRKRKGQGLFGKSKPTPKYSDKAWKKEGDQYEHDGYTVVKHMVDTFAQKGKLEKGYSATRVDAMLSKYVDEPRNIDGLRRVEKWAKHLLESKTYAREGDAFMKDILDLQHISLA